MGLELKNPLQFTIKNWNGQDTEDVRFVQYSGNVCGIFILSSKNLLVHVTRQESGAAGVTQKWDFRFSGKTPIQILYLGSSAFLEPGLEHLMVVKEQQGVVFYRVDPSGAEELVTDIRFHNIRGSSVTQAKFLMGNIFEDTNLNPGLVYQPPEGEVSIFAANYRSWEDSEEDPLSEGELQLSERLLGKNRLWIIQGGEGRQDFIVAAPTHNRMEAYDGNSTLEWYRINAGFELELWSIARLPAQVQPQSMDFAFGDSSHMQNQLVVYFDGSLGIVYNSSLGSNDFVPNAYFYSNDGPSARSKALRISGPRSNIILNGPKILQTNNNDSVAVFLKDEGYWSGQYLKPLAFSQTQNTVLYEQNKTLHVSNFHINQFSTQVEARPNFRKEVETFWSSSRASQEIPVNENATNWNSYDLPLQEQIRLEQFLEPAVNLPSGQLSLALSLIPGVNFQLQYSPSSGTGPGNGDQAVGRNWELHGASYVALDMRQSHFLHNRSYYIVYNGQAFSINESGREEGGALRFQTSNDTEDDDSRLLDVTFYPDSNTWKARTSSAQLTFGGDLERNSIKKGVISMNWAMDGEAQTRSLALEWHLTEEEDLLTRKKLSYEYVQQMEVEQGIELTKHVHLKRVKGQNMDAIFEIDSSTQYLLKGYNFRSSKYSQRVKFAYNYVGGDRFLSEVSQCFQTSSTCLPVLEFSYSPTLPSQLVNVTIPPWHTLVTYTYRNPSAPAEPAAAIAVTPSSAAQLRTTSSAVHGQGFSAFATEDSVHVYKITDGNLTSFRIQERLDANHRLAMEGRCIFFFNENKLRTFCASRGDGNDGEFTWEAKRGLSLDLYSSQEVLMTSKGAVLVQTGPRSLALHQYDVSQDSWITAAYFTQGSIKYMRVEDKLDVIAWMDDLNQVYWITQPSGDSHDRLSWTPVQTMNLSPRTSCSTLFSRIFSLGSKLEQDIQEFFANFDFQLKDNIISLYSCRISGSTLESVVDLLILDENAEAVNRQLPIAKSNLLDLKFEQEKEEDGRRYTLTYKYEMSGDKFLVRIDVRGQTKAVSDDLTFNFRRNEEGKDSRTCLVNIGHFEMSLLPSSVIHAGNNVKIGYDNRRGWVRGSHDSHENNPYYLRVPLNSSNDDLYLLKEDANATISINSASSGDLIYDFGSTNLTQLGFFYPNYIAAPSGSSNVLSIVRFEGGSRIKASQLEGVENIPNLSGPQVLVTQGSVSTDTRIPIVLRSILSDPQQVLSKFHVRSGSTLDRVVHYEYDRPSRLLTGNLLFHQSHVMPGKIPRYYGWIQRDATQTSNGTIWTTKTYDRDGNFVEDTNTGKEPEPENDGRDTPFILTDNSGKFKITNFSPFELSSCNTGYIGFEDYQSHQTHTNCSQWEFPASNIIRNGYGFTGRNFLRLSSSNDTLEMEIPWEQGQSYTVSAWTRTNTTEGAVGGGSYIFASLGNASSPLYWISQKIYSWGRWNLNRLDIKGMDIEPYRALLYNASSPLEESSTLRIKFGISTDENVTLDVDDVIFAPETWDSEVTVRDPETFLPTETFLGRSGLTTKRKYNALGKPLVHINPKGQVQQIHLESTSVNDHGLKSSVLFQTTGAPGWYEYCEPALNQGLRVKNNTQNWSVSPGKIHHSGPKQEDLNLDFGSQSSVLFHFSVSMKEDGSSFKLRFYGTTLTCTRKGEAAFLEIEGVACSTRSVGDDNDILVAIIEKSRFALWVGGDLVCEDLLDPSNAAEPLYTLDMTLAGEVSIANMVIIPDPSIEVRYSNLEDQIVQNLLLQSADSIQVMQKFYDELGRSIGQTKKTLVRSSSGPLFGFRPSFAITSTNTLGGSPLQVQGEVSQLNPLDGNYPFTQIRYNDRVMIEDWEAEGRPGERYRLGGQFETVYSTDPNHLVQILFPPEQDHHYRVVRTTQGYEETQVFTGKHDNERLVAEVGLLPNGEQLLSTYTYDFHGNLISATAPNFHRRNRTFMKGIPYSQHATSDLAFKNTYKFDSKSRIVEKRTTDGGISNLVYDQKDNVIYAIHRANVDPAVIDSIIYFDYEHQGEGALVEVGVLRNFTATASPTRVLEEPYVKVPKKIIERRVLQEENAFFRSDVISSLYEGASANYTETVGYDAVLNKPLFSGEVFRIPRNDTDTLEVLRAARFEYNCKGDRVLKAGLPFKSFSIQNKYTPSGNLQGVDLLDEENSLRLNLVEYTYDGENHVISEKLSDFGGSHRLITNFAYNSPGYPSKQSNSLVDEEMNYEDSGYGGYSLGRPNAPMWSKFLRKWTNPSSRVSTKGFEKAGLSPTYAETCFQALLQSGYIDENGRILQLLHPGLAPSQMPPQCLLGSDAEILAKVFHSTFVQQKSFGFKYQYGTHNDLIKSKFVDFSSPGECSEPLTKGSFSRNLTPHSRNATDALWDNLVGEGFLLIDQQIGISSSLQGRRGSSLVNPAVVSGIQSLPMENHFYIEHLVHHFAQNPSMAISPSHLSTLLQGWGSPSAKSDADKIFRFLSTNAYISVSSQKPTPLILHPKLVGITAGALTEEEAGSFQVFRTLQAYFNCAISKSPFDLQVLDQDANGNFKLFYNGQGRVELQYEPGTNKVSRMITFGRAGSEEFQVGHDSFGNLNVALHKNIRLISYDEVFARPLSFHLLDGTEIKFRYNHRGERVSKQLWSPQGRLLYLKTYTTRDDNGRCLLEEETTFVSDSVPPQVRLTVYIYGARGLVGFWRDGKVYNVYTDNVGSVRFVILNGEVVASYDYLPYGELMSSYLQDPAADISYRFTGQEWDRETNLYNFHSRIYDPFLGRFYQLDPEEQFFSPYKYGGNSPLNVVDPDGKFVQILLPIILGLAGAYLAAASANNSWNPAKWDFAKASTWAGLIFGGLAGASIPFTAGLSAEFIGTTLAVSSTAANAIVGGVGIGAAYLSTAAMYKNFNPAQWDWASPQTLNSLFGGYSMGSGTFAGVGYWKSGLSSLTGTLGKTAYISGTVAAGGGFAYLQAGAANNNFNPAEWDWRFTWINLATGGIAGATGVAGFKSGMQFMGTQIKTFSPGFQNMAKGLLASTKSLNPSLLKGLNQQQMVALGKFLGSGTAVAGLTYLSLASASDDWTSFNFNTVATTNALINGLYSGWMGGSGPKMAIGKSKVSASAGIKNWFKSLGMNARCKRTAGGTCSTNLPMGIQRNLDKMAYFGKKLREKLENSLETKKGKKLGVTIGVISGRTHILAGISGSTESNLGGFLAGTWFDLNQMYSDFQWHRHELVEARMNKFQFVELVGNVPGGINVPMARRASTGMAPTLRRMEENIQRTHLARIEIEMRPIVKFLVEKLDPEGLFKDFPFLRTFTGENLKSILELEMLDVFPRDYFAIKELGLVSILPRAVFQVAKKAGLDTGDFRLENINIETDSLKGFSASLNYLKREKKADHLVFTGWHRSNCAENKCFNVLHPSSHLWKEGRMIQEFFTTRYSAGLPFQFDDIELVAAFDRKKFEPKESCANCAITINNIKAFSPSMKVLTNKGEMSTYTQTVKEKPELAPNFDHILEVLNQYVEPYRKRTRLPRAVTRNNTRIRFSKASSSASFSHQGILISFVKLVTGWFGALRDPAASTTINSLFPPPTKTSLLTLGAKGRNTKEPRRNSGFNWANCLPYVWVNGEYNLQGFTCHSREGVVQVIPKSLNEIGRKHNNPLVGASSIRQDTFSDCQFMYGYFGGRAAFCEGRNSDFIYTPYRTSLPGEGLNEQLLLLILGVHLWETWTTEKDFHEETLCQRPAEMFFDEFYQRARAIRNNIAKMTLSQTDPYMTKWLAYLTEDLEEEIEIIKQKGCTAEQLLRFEEKVEDLEEELRMTLTDQNPSPEVYCFVEATPGSVSWQKIASYFMFE